MKNNNFDVFSTKFAQDMFLQKYSLNQSETWADTSKRVTEAVCNQLVDSKTKEKIYQTILERKFIPGGRYLYSSGRSFHQVNNCFLFRAEDSREGWSDVMGKVTSALMTGGGVGVSYSNLREEGAQVKRTGGESTGPIALMNMINEAGRYIMQGGQRRSAIWAGLNWKHKDIFKFLDLKNHSQELRQLKEKDLNFHLPMELTNISVEYDTEFFVAIENPEHPLHLLAMQVWMKNCSQAFSTAEPGMSFNFRKDNENLRNACQPAFAPIEILDKGLSTFSDLVVGDKIRSETGWTKVVKKWSNGTKPVFLYTFSNGSNFIGTQDHKLKVYTKDNSLEKIEVERCFNSEIRVLTVVPGSIPGYITKEYSKIISKSYLGDHEVFDITVDNEEHTYLTGGVVVSNCTEVVSDDDSDKCNLGTLWINRIKNKKELAEVTKLATTFLLCGSIYSDVPNQRIREVGNKNNRIGLGLGGIHEWLMLKGSDYEVTPELHKWLSIYEQESDAAAFVKAKELSVSVPKGVRAIAPTGTIGIIAETTTGIEPLFSASYIRRYFKEGKWMHQYVVDGSVKRLLDQGVKIEHIKDSYDITFKQRVKFQADVQNYVDMSISSTCNVPAWGSAENNESNLKDKSDILLKYARRLRGFTVYPDGCRGGQPLTRCNLEEALASEGKVFEESETECVGGVCGL
jgi:hypothetical protein